jgi:simple sugar transport system ATP-binding protein
MSAPTAPSSSDAAILADGRPFVPPLISLHRIRKVFGSSTVLHDVDLDLYAGECLGLVGDNAAGKSTLSKVISGAYLPDGGEMRIEGEVVRLSGPAEARDRHIEMVYQELSLCDTIDVAGNLFLGREICHGRFLAKAEMERAGREMLDALDIRIPNMRAKVAQLSGGQRQSIAIARAASFSPKVLLLDEPTSALAVAEVEAVLALINRVKRQGVAVILVTHRLQDLFRVCDRLAFMYEGRKVAERPMAETNLDEIVKLIVGGDSA